MKSFFKTLPYLFSTCIALSLCSSVSAQTPLESLVSAEKSFAKYASDHTTQEAFVQFLAPDAIVFGQGKAMNGLEVWKSRKPDSILFSWHPTVAAVSPAGDLGFTAGPYDIKRNRKDEAPVAYGHYITVWKKQANGEWKAQVDCGVPHQKPETEEAIHIGLPNEPKTASKFEKLKEAEAAFISSVSASGVSAYQHTLSSQAKIYRPGTIIIPASEISKTQKYTYQLLDGGISKSNNFGYVYGNATLNDGGKTSNVNYLRVWQLENGQWKIVVDVITG